MSLDPTDIRSLILAHDWTRANPSLTVDFICEEIANPARKAGILGDQYFDILQRITGTGKNVLKPVVADETWQLVLEGVFRPGSHDTFRVTPYGAKVLAEKEVTPHDHEGYLQAISKQSPKIDGDTRMYLSEALRSFQTGNHLASTVMLGVASESVLVRVVKAMEGAFDSETKKESFVKATKDKFASTQHAEVWKRLQDKIAVLPRDLQDSVGLHLKGMFDVIRLSRNEAGHPSGKPMERSNTYSLLTLFPYYAKTAHQLMDWLGSNKI
jgi:hypothetical protein